MQNGKTAIFGIGMLYVMDAAIGSVCIELVRVCFLGESLKIASACPAGAVELQYLRICGLFNVILVYLLANCKTADGLAVLMQKFVFFQLGENIHNSAGVMNIFHVVSMS